MGSSVNTVTVFKNKDNVKSRNYYLPTIRLFFLVILNGAPVFV